MKFFRRRKEESSEPMAIAAAEKIIRRSEDEIEINFFLHKKTLVTLKGFADIWYGKYPKTESRQEIVVEKLGRFLEGNVRGDGAVKVAFNRNDVRFFLQVRLAAATCEDDFREKLGLLDRGSPQIEAMNMLAAQFVAAGGNLLGEK